MKPPMRTWALVAVIVLALINALINKAVPAWMLTRGHDWLVPAWMRLFFSNALILFLVLILADLGRHLLHRHRIASLILVVLAVFGPVLSLCLPARSPWATTILGFLAVLVVGHMSRKRQVPLRVYHGLAWYVLTALLCLVPSLLGSALSPSWSGWLTVSIEICACLTAAAFFMAWCTPIRSISLKAALVALLAAVDLALVVSLGGHGITAALLATSGLTMCLPLMAYTLGAFLITATFLTLLGQQGQGIRGLAILMLTIGGLSFADTASVLLVLLAMTLLVVSYPYREHSLWHDWKQVLSQRVPEPETQLAESAPA